MHVTALAGGPLFTIGYLAYDRPGGSALIVDAPFGSTRRFREAIRSARLRLLYVVNTHGHWDHTADNVPLIEATGASLCAHTWDATRLANPRLAAEDDEAPALPVKPSKADQNLQDGTLLEVGECRFEVIHTPGHTPGSICLYEAKAGVLFTGDTIYRMGVGRTDCPGGSSGALAQSLNKLAMLPNSTRIYPGHGLSTTIGEERWLLQLAATPDAS